MILDITKSLTKIAKLFLAMTLVLNRGKFEDVQLVSYFGSNERWSSLLLQYISNWLCLRIKTAVPFQANNTSQLT